MNIRFLPRQPGSIETGPQLFAGTNDLNTTIYFGETLGLLNSVKTEGGGAEGLNGIFVYTSIYNDRPYYNKDGDGNLFIIYNDDQWEIYNFGMTDEPIFISNPTTAQYPWNIINWYTTDENLGPAPKVTKVL
jgi:hypothetical protein